MSGTARVRHMAEFMSRMYPAFSRRATQVCILSAALEKIERGEPDAQAIARAALAQADAFGWNTRAIAGVPDQDEPCRYPDCSCPNRASDGMPQCSGADAALGVRGRDAEASDGR